MSVISRSRFPAGLLSALAVVAGLEFCAFRPRGDLGSFIPASWVEASRAARSDAVSADVLFLGDSQIKGGLLPSAFDKDTHLRSYNLATIGGQPAAALALLKQAVESGAKPQAVVFGFYPGLLAADSRINLRQWPEVLGLGACLNLIWTSGDLAFAAPLLTRSLLPSLLRRDDIRAATVAMVSETPDPGRAKTLAYQRNWRLNAGAQALAANPAFRDDPSPPAGEPGSAENRAGENWRAKDEHCVHLRELLAYAESRGIAIFWLLPTNSPGLQQFRISLGLDETFVRFVKSFQREFPKLTVLDPSRLLKDPSRFFDPCHLHRDGALALSVSTAETFAIRLTRERVGIIHDTNWVLLNGREMGSPLAADLPEDLDQSTRNIHSGPQGRTIRR